MTQKIFNYIGIGLLLILLYTSITLIIKGNKIEKELANKPNNNTQTKPTREYINAQDFASGIRSKLRENVSEVNIKFDN